MGIHRNGEFSAEVVRRDGHAVVIVRGEIDLATADLFRRAVDCAAAGSCRIEVDLRATTFMDAAGLAVLLCAYQRLGRAPESIVLTQPPPIVVTLLEVTGVDSIFDIRVDVGPDEPLELFTRREPRREVAS